MVCLLLLFYQQWVCTRDETFRLRIVKCRQSDDVSPPECSCPTPTSGLPRENQHSEILSDRDFRRSQRKLAREHTLNRMYGCIGEEEIVT